MLLNQLDFEAWRAAQAMILHASRLSEVEKLRLVVREFAQVLTFLQKG